jgi:hypothetical protein
MKEQISKIMNKDISRKKFLTILGGSLLGLTLFSKEAMAKMFIRTENSSMISLTNKSIQLNGDLRGAYQNASSWKLLDMETGTSLFPNGITITSIYVKANVADPTTELNANIMYCDAQGTGAFPGANPTSIATIDTTTGNYSQTGMTTSVATNKIVYLLMDADPTDFNVNWSIVINYTIN